MAIGRIDVDLSNAIPATAPVKQDIGGAYWVRFHVVPSGANARFETNGTSIPVVAPFTIRSCSQPIQRVIVDNDNTAGQGTLVILYGDTQQELEDFLANAAPASEWVPYAILLPNQDAGGWWNLLEPNINNGGQLGSSANVGVTQSNPDQRHAMRVGIGAGGAAGRGYAVRERNDIAPLYDYLFAPALTSGVGRSKKIAPSLRLEFDVWADIARTAGQELQAACGWIQANNIQENYGVTFLMAPNVTGNNNWHAAVIDYSGGAVGNKPLVADRIVFQDLGIDATTLWHQLAIEMGQSGGIPYISWEIDDVELYKSTGELATWPDQWNINIGEGVAINKSAVADKAYLWTTGARFYRKLATV